jgi:hypothetical protein
MLKLGFRKPRLILVLTVVSAAMIALVVTAAHSVPAGTANAAPLVVFDLTAIFHITAIVTAHIAAIIASAIFAHLSAIITAETVSASHTIHNDPSCHIVHSLPPYAVGAGIDASVLLGAQLKPPKTLNTAPVALVLTFKG